MKAMVCQEYGPPDVLKLEEIDKPILKDDEMLVKVHAASVNTVDVFFRSGMKVFFGLSRFATGILKPKRKVAGFDVAGEIVQIGVAITKFKIGDQVYGIARTGSCAEFAKVSERGVAIKPSNMSYSEAAAVPGAGLTALQFLRDLGNVQKGQKVLIYGASGGNGTYAVQLAKYYDAEVTAVCSGKNRELVKNLGADRVIDYTKEDFTNQEERYDVILDTIGKVPLSKWKTALKENGVFLNVGSPDMPIIRVFLKVFGNTFRKKKYRTLTTQTNNKDLVFLAKLIDEGKIKSIIDKSYSLEETAKAHRDYENGHTAGKVVINIIPDDTKD